MLGVKLESTLRTVGYFKGLVRIIKREDGNSKFDITKLFVPSPYVVRLYVMAGAGVQPRDCDPYLKLKLGKTKVDDVDNHQTDTSNPEFFR